jgi:hypothetical protein
VRTGELSGRTVQEPRTEKLFRTTEPLAQPIQPHYTGAMSSTPPRLFSRIARVKSLAPMRLNQILTYLAVCEEGKYGKGGAMMGKDHAGAEKMVDRLAECVKEVSGEALLRPPPDWGGRLELTPSGERIHQMCNEILDAVERAVLDLRGAGSKIKVGAIRFEDKFLREIFSLTEARLKTAGLQPFRGVLHVSSIDAQRSVLNRDVDCCLGEVLAEEKSNQRGEILTELFSGIRFIRAKSESFGLLSTYDVGNEISPDEIVKRRLPVIIPTQGIIHDLLLRLFGNNYPELSVDETSDDALFTLNNLHETEYDVSMFATQAMFRFERERAGSAHIRFTKLRDCKYSRWVGLFLRQGERSSFGPRHPLPILWDAVDAYRDGRR